MHVKMNYEVDKQRTNAKSSIHKRANTLYYTHTHTHEDRQKDIDRHE